MFHCFADGMELARYLVERGMHIVFLWFFNHKKAQRLEAVAADEPFYQTIRKIVRSFFG